MLIGIAIEIPFALGEALLGVEAYFIRDWTTLQNVAYLPLLCEHFVFRSYPGNLFYLVSAVWAVLGCSRICQVADWCWQVGRSSLKMLQKLMEEKLQYIFSKLLQ